MGCVGIVITTYNNENYIDELIQCCINQTYKDFEVHIADDGSTDGTIDNIEKYIKLDQRIHLHALPHGERGIARLKGIEAALEDAEEFLLIIDSDMMLEPHLLESAVGRMRESETLSALVIKEKPYSSAENFFTKVKIFERELINNSGQKLDKNSIEAARFWRIKAYLDTGGIHPDQIAFEEIQPTIRCIEQGGTVEKLMTSGLRHDEKMVTFSNIIQKKKYYFSVMDRTVNTEKNGLSKVIKRWYFFRPVYYRKENLKLYVKHPLLTGGVIYMYLVLTFIGVKALFKGKWHAGREGV